MEKGDGFDYKKRTQKDYSMTMKLQVVQEIKIRTYKNKSPSKRAFAGGFIFVGSYFDLLNNL